MTSVRLNDIRKTNPMFLLIFTRVCALPAAMATAGGMVTTAIAQEEDISLDDEEE